MAPLTNTTIPTEAQKRSDILPHCGRYLSLSLSQFFIEEFRAVKCNVSWKFSASGVEWTIPNVQSHFSTHFER
jgi:hypothetical protein